MTPKERWLAAIRMQPADRLPFWPKLDAAYPRAQEDPFRQMRLDAIHDWIGSDKHVSLPTCAKAVRRTTSAETSKKNGLRRTVFRTRSGRTQLVERFDEASQSWHPVEFPVRGLDEVRIMTEVFSDCSFELDAEALERAKARAEEIGHDAATYSAIGESPLMYWVEWLAGVENGHYLLADHREEVEGLFDAIHRTLVRKTEILAEHSPCDMLYLFENTSTTLISPAQFRDYCCGHIQGYGRIARGAGRLLVLHMCGKLKALLPDLAGLLAAAFEAFTSPPVGNTSLLDGRAACPAKCLIGGTNAALWTRSADEIIAGIEKDLDELPHHRGLVVTSAGVMPPLCKPGTIRLVCDWVKAYGARM